MGICRVSLYMCLILMGICLMVIGIGGQMPLSPVIAYMAEKSDSNSWDLFMMDMRTGVTLRLTNTHTVDERYPAWASAGNRLAYHHNETGTFNLAVMTLNQTIPTYTPFLLEANMGDLTTIYDRAMPAWSYDDTYLGFHAKTRNGRYGLFMGYADGRETRMIINPPELGDVVQWAWSPDATQIAFTQTMPTESHIYLLTLPEGIQPFATNRANMRRIIENANFPAWSPDGTKIAYVQQLNDISVVNRIWIYDFVTNTQFKIVPSGYRWTCDELHPEWTPDGQSIVFATDCNTLSERNFDIYIVNADGTGLRRLTFGAMDELAPDWGIYDAGG